MKEDDLSFSHIIDDDGFYFNFKNFHIRFNPRLYRTIYRYKGAHLILGSSWNDFNILSVCVLKRLKLIKNTVSFWTEANYNSIYKTSKPDSSIKKALRRWVLNTCDGYFFIPGETSRITLFEKWGIEMRPVIKFPNLVSEEFYNIDQSKNLFRKQPDLEMIIVARHMESSKGILNFLSRIDSFDEIRIKLAGVGDDTKRYQDFVAEKGLEDKVIFLGELDVPELIEQLTASHLFILPSYHDQSPLSVVEAAIAGLPLLVSERCGNHPELIRHGVNGYTFDPTNSKQINHFLNEIRSKSSAELLKMGRSSRDLAIESYDPNIVLNSAIEALSQ
ncbi:glycosyltransferase family 4 protein [Nonlabens spongiae]|uniref:glycosyltransferase family 4 protein n=1 Tax=Nonlabens spongiae TaxID=331648 RepID=UPI00146EE633|nr:glycosyltransferase family 4 protein [Nonlabens spongiae]